MALKVCEGSEAVEVLLAPLAGSPKFQLFVSAPVLLFVNDIVAGTVQAFVAEGVNPTVG